MGNKLRWATVVLTVSAGLVVGTGRFEGKSNVAYTDRLASSRVVTICYGHTGDVHLGDTMTDVQCDALLAHDLNEKYAPLVRSLVKVPLTQGEFDALVDFVYNLGYANLKNSRLLAKVNAGDYAGAQLEFMRWYKTGGKDCRIRKNSCYGIIERRIWETNTFAS